MFNHKILFLIVLALTPFCVVSEKFRFDNYTLYKIIPANEGQIKLLQDVHDNDLRYDFWTSPGPSAEFVNLMSSPEHSSDLEYFMNKNNIKFSISMSNLQEAIEKERFKTYMRGDIRSMQFDAYYTLEQINNWIDDLAVAYPNLVSTLVAGRSYEGRDIKGLRISHGTGRKIIFIEGGMHAREWISPATLNFIINELLTSDDEEIKAAAREYDWYIFPVTNPDGYIWSHTQFRMWRKNRRPIGSNVGVDLNRNWNNNWLDPLVHILSGEAVNTRPIGRQACSRWFDALVKIDGGNLHRAAHYSHDRALWRQIVRGHDPQQ